MIAARKRYLDRMSATLEEWSTQIADLQAKARSAGGEQQQLISRRIAALYEQRTGYLAHMNETRDTSAGMLRDMEKGAKRIAAEFRRIYVQSASRFGAEMLPSGSEAATVSCSVARRRPDPDQVTAAAGGSMTMRTSRSTVIFERPFSLKGIDRELPAGSYMIDTDEKLIEGVSFPAYRRVATTIFVPSQPGGVVSGQVVTIDPSELAAAQTRDAGNG
jgi:hypothetical protein